MTKHRPNSYVVVAVCASVFFFLFGTVQAADNILTKQLRNTIARISKGETLGIRTTAAEHLFELTRKQHQNIDGPTINTIISLLDSPDDPVRYWVAMSLGNFGPRARAAVPKLQQILAEVECIEFGKNSTGGIRRALEQIGVSPPPRNCGD